MYTLRLGCSLQIQMSCARSGGIWVETPLKTTAGYYVLQQFCYQHRTAVRCLFLLGQCCVLSGKEGERLINDDLALSEQLLLKAEVAVHGHLLVGDGLHATRAELHQSARLVGSGHANISSNAVTTKVGRSQRVVDAQLPLMLQTEVLGLYCRPPY